MVETYERIVRWAEFSDSLGAKFFMSTVERPEIFCLFGYFSDYHALDPEEEQEIAIPATIFRRAVCRLQDGQAETRMNGFGKFVREGESVTYTTECEQDYTFALDDLLILAELT